MWCVSATAALLAAGLGGGFAPPRTAPDNSIRADPSISLRYDRELIDVHDLVVSADHGQIYIYAHSRDPVRDGPSPDADNPFLIALDDAVCTGSEGRRSPRSRSPTRW